MTQNSAGSTSQTALVTGGTRGIGLGIARELARSGWSLMLNGVRPAGQIQQVLEELQTLGGQAEYCQADLSSPEDRERLIETTFDRFGELHSLVNNAGIPSPVRKDLLDADEESFDRVLSVNLKGPYFLTQLAARRMIAQGDAERRRSIVFVTSISAEVASVNRGDYCLSKAALAMASQLWAARLAEHAIDVYEVRPGIIRTDMTAGVTEKYDQLIANGLMLEARWGTPEDVGKAVRALVAGDIPYATGQVLHVDGGMGIRRL